MASGVTLESLERVIDRMAQKPVIVLGDPVLDVYIYGTTMRISREAPVPIVREDDVEKRLGGAANAAANLAALGGQVQLVGLVGDDAGAEDLAALCAARGIDTSGFVVMKQGCTVSKTRVLAGGLHTTKQQLLRIDRENDGERDPADRARLAEAASRALEGSDALIISDYDGGLTTTFAEVGRAAAAESKTVVVDSRFGLPHYRGATVVTPNEPEAEAALHTQLDSEAAAVEAAERLRAELDLEATLLTRGREGMAIARRGEATTLLGAHGALQALDVTGAGDTVTATFTLAMAAGASILEAAVLANCAASVVVQEIGAATCTPDTLKRELARWNAGALRPAP